VARNPATVRVKSPPPWLTFCAVLFLKQWREFADNPGLPRDRRPSETLTEPMRPAILLDPQVAGTGSEGFPLEVLRQIDRAISGLRPEA
jgi:hypothetical protein